MDLVWRGKSWMVSIHVVAPLRLDLDSSVGGQLLAAQEVDKQRIDELRRADVRSMTSRDHNGKGGTRDRCRDRAGHGQRHRSIELAVKNQGRCRDRGEDRGRGQEVASEVLLPMLLDEDLRISLESDREDGVDERLRARFVERHLKEPAGETRPVVPPVRRAPPIPTLIQGPLDPEPSSLDSADEEARPTSIAAPTRISRSTRPGERAASRAAVFAPLDPATREARATPAACKTATASATCSSNP